jgi:phosphoribosylglycinamide formyltransferase-1
MAKKVAIFASGSGSNAENIIRYFSETKNVIFPFILSNKADAFVKNRAEKLNIPFIFFTKEQWINGEILNLLKKEGVDWIVLAGFLLKVPTEIIEAYPHKIINIHPSLLPKYGGKGMYGMKVHEAVAEANEKESGITIHYVNENLDEGEIIFQAKCEVLSTDSPEEIAAKVHKLEYEFFPKVIADLLEKDSKQ